MFLHLYKGKGSHKFRFKILSSSGKTIIKSKYKFKSKKLRKKFLKSLFNNSYNLKSVTKHTSTLGLYYFSIADINGRELARSKKYKKRAKRNLKRKEYLRIVNELNKPSALKTRKIVDKERQILKTGKYPLGHYEYSIFLSSNGKHYFTFKGNDGKTVLLNSNIQGFKTLSEAEVKLQEVVDHAQDENLFEIKETKNGKFFFYLFNRKSQKIAKSFFYGKKIDAENVISKFVGKKPKIEVKASKDKPVIEVKPAAAASSISNPVSQPPKESIANDLLTDREKYLKQKELEKIKLERELEERREKRRLQRLEREKLEREKVEKAKENLTKKESTTNQYYHDDEDGFGGCLKWLFGILSLLLLVLLCLWIFKGCGDGISKGEPIAHEAEIIDSSIFTSDTIVNSSINQEVEKGQAALSEDINNTEQTQKTNEGSKSYSNSSCGCSNSIEIFKVPDNSEAKSIESLISNPQFGSFPGNSGSDLLDDLKYQASLSRNNSSFLKYLFQSMGYKGLSDVKAKDISLVKIPKGSKGVMGFGKYNGYKYVSLDIPQSQLQAFKIDNANGCSIYLTKSGGNFFYPCE